MIATNSLRHKIAAGKGKRIVEFGLRRAQGPDGGMSASRYAYLGGADGTSNVLASRLFGIPCSGTHAHAFVTSFSSVDDVRVRTIVDRENNEVDLLQLSKECLLTLGFDGTNENELCAFVTYALAFPDGFLALVDTYDTLVSGVPNFLAVSLALHRCGRRAVGIRLDSGDLAYLSRSARAMFVSAAAALDDAQQYAYWQRFTIVASNGIDEATLRSLNEQGHQVDVFGIGTNLVTCRGNPALGIVCKLVEVDGRGCIKLSEDIGKASLPGRKNAFRLYGESHALVDLLKSHGKPAPTKNERLLCVHPFVSHKRAYVTPAHVEPLLRLYWAGKNAAVIDEELQLAQATSFVDQRIADGASSGFDHKQADAIGNERQKTASKLADKPWIKPETESGRVVRALPPLAHLRQRVLTQIELVREDHLRPMNPTPYKVSVTQKLHDFIAKMWLQAAPIPEMK